MTLEETMDALPLMLARRSIRRYAADDVAVEDEEKLLDAAFAAPSACNLRPWHFVVVRDRAIRSALSAVHRHSKMLARAPLVIGVLGRADGQFWVEDCSAATENILLEATSLGLGSVWVGMWENEPEVCAEERRCLEILGTTPDDWRCLAMIGIGHPVQQRQPRTQREARKISYERVGNRSR
jgi:nitroreductase